VSCVVRALRSSETQRNRSVAAGRRPQTMAQKSTTDGKPTQCRRPHNLPCTQYKACCIHFDDKPPFIHRSIPSRTSVSTPLPPLTRVLSDKTDVCAWDATDDCSC